MKRILATLCLFTLSAPVVSLVGIAEGQTTHNLDIIFQRGIPDTSLRYWGAAIAGVGDVNGDGYDDVAVGCFRTTGVLETDTAYVYVYYGSTAGIDTTYDLLIKDWAKGWNGISICGGDINKDGYSDIMINPNSCGKVYIHYGGSPPSQTADIVFGGRLYESLTTLACGDINGDDTTDLIAADYANMSGNGHVNIYLGSAQFDTIPWLVIRGRDYEQLGSSLSANADLNGDNINDLAVGAATYNVDSRGRLYAFWGGAAMDTLPDWWKDGEGPGQYWGEMSVSLVKQYGEYGRYWAGSMYYPGSYGNTKNNGKAVLFDGGAVMDTFPEMSIVGADTFTRLGVTFASSLLDSGFYGDVICGAIEYDAIGKGRVWTSTTTQDTIVDGWATGRWYRDFLGVNAANAGDVDNDGKEEIMFGSYADTNRLVVICKYTGPNGVAGPSTPLGDRPQVKLFPNVPNPFSQITTIKYQITNPGRATIKVYNVAGQLVRDLTPAPSHNALREGRVRWDGRDEKGREVSSGVYICKLGSGNDSKTIKMTFIK